MIRFERVRLKVHRVIARDGKWLFIFWGPWEFIAHAN